MTQDPADGPPAPHVLDSSRYFTTEDAPYDSWMLLEKVEVDIDGYKDK